MPTTPASVSPATQHHSSSAWHLLRVRIRDSPGGSARAVLYSSWTRRCLPIGMPAGQPPHNRVRSIHGPRDLEKGGRRRTEGSDSEITMWSVVSMGRGSKALGGDSSRKSSSPWLSAKERLSAQSVKLPRQESDTVGMGRRSSGRRLQAASSRMEVSMTFVEQLTLCSALAQSTYAGGSSAGVTPAFGGS